MALKSSLKQLARSRYFALGAIVPLALGLALCTTMFGLLDALLLRAPVGVADPDRVVRLTFEKDDPLYGRAVLEKASFPALMHARATGAFESVAGYAFRTVSIGQGKEAVLAEAMLVTPEFFRLFRLVPRRGTLFGAFAADTALNEHIVLSEEFWLRNFGGDPNVIGEVLRLGDHLYTVTGIAPKNFSVLQPRRTDLWLLLGSSATNGLLWASWKTDRNSQWLSAVGRLRHGTDPPTTERHAREVLRHRRSTSGDLDAPTAIATIPLLASRGPYKLREVNVSIWLAAVTVFVLIIACVTVASLLLTRNIARRREYGIRLALGASHRQLYGLMVSDVAVIVMPAVVIAFAFDALARGAIPAYLPYELPIPQAIFDRRWSAMLLGSGAITFVLVALVSLIQSHVTGLEVAVAAASTDRSVGKGYPRSLRGLFVVQSGLCAFLLIGASLFARSLARVQSLDLGVDLDRTVQISFDLARDSRSLSDVRSLYEQAATRLAAHPEVERVAVAERDPYMSGRASAPWTDERSREQLYGDGEVPYVTAVGAGFFLAVGARSLRGRDFSEIDRSGAPPVAIVNGPLARRLWPTEDALGKCIWLDHMRHCTRIIAVIEGVLKHSALRRDKMAIYVPLEQLSSAVPGSILIRTRKTGGAVLTSLREVAQSTDLNLPASRVQRVRDLVDWEFRPWRLGAIVFSFFGLAALVITAIGLYSVIAFATTLQRREIGIRRSLGAPKRHIVGVVAGQEMIAVSSGLGFGIVAALLASRWLGTVLFQTSAREPVVFLQTAFLLLAAALGAILIPLIRILRENPSVSLRDE